MPKDRVAEQGDVDGLLEYSLAFGMVASETRWRVAAQQEAGSLRWIGVDPSEMQRLQADTQARCGEFPLSAGWTRETHWSCRSTSYFAGEWRLGGLVVH